MEDGGGGVHLPRAHGFDALIRPAALRHVLREQLVVDEEVAEHGVGEDLRSALFARRGRGAVQDEFAHGRKGSPVGRLVGGRFIRRPRADPVGA